MPQRPMQKISNATTPKKSVTTLACVAGRSGGHILPCLTLAQHSNATTTLFFSTHAPLDQALLKNEPIIHIPLKLNNIPYKNPLRWIPFCWDFARALYTSLSSLYTYKPEKVISTGGYIALPVCIAAALLRIPIELYELNVSPGQAILWLTPLATTVYVCFEESKQYFPARKCVLTDYPLRTMTEQPIHYNACNLTPGKKTVLVFGGSQGSEFLNSLMQHLFSAHPELNNHLQLIHQTGSTAPEWHDWYTQHTIGAHVFDYDAHVSRFYPLVDMIICRAGAGTLFEVCTLNKPIVTIPLETAITAHQLENAYAMQRKYPDMVRVIKQESLEQTTKQLYNALQQIIKA